MIHEDPSAFGEETTIGTPSPAVEARAFADWLARFDPSGAASLEALDRIVAQRKPMLPAKTIPLPLLSAAASWLGETVRSRHGGTWKRLGEPFEEVLSFETGVFLRPLEVVLKAWELAPEFRVAEFVAALPKRLEAEETFPAWAPLVIPSPSPDAPRTGAEEFRRAWNDRFKRPLPLSLNGVRELDRMLRSNFLLCSMNDDALVGAGLFVGEVARGLFGGEWRFDEVPPWHRVALEWPELRLRPIGRIFKMFTELPEGEPLDEFVRVVPAARKELRSRS